MRMLVVMLLIAVMAAGCKQEPKGIEIQLEVIAACQNRDGNGSHTRSEKTPSGFVGMGY